MKQDPLQSLDTGPAHADGLDVEAIEIGCCLDALCERYGYDFRQYSRNSLTRRFRRWLVEEDLPTISHAQAQLLRDATKFKSFLHVLTVHVSEMFRDPPFFLHFRERILPLLKSYPSLSFWSAGCAGGEEAYSIAIILEEEGLIERSRIFATDIDAAVLGDAIQGIFAQDRMQEHTALYQKAGGKDSFASYYHCAYSRAIMKQSLRKAILFSEHNLIADEVFGEMNMIFCRNVLIYFEPELRKKVVHLFARSLRRGGFLVLGSKERLDAELLEGLFKPWAECPGIYRMQGEMR